MDWYDRERVLDLWPAFAGAQTTLVNVSENHTFRLDAPDGQRAMLRVHRPRYHTRLAIESELAWMQALRRDQGLFTPKPIPGANGEPVQRAPFTAPEDERHMVLFVFEPGEAPRLEQDLAPIFEQIGAFAAQCHAHVERWELPTPFQRQFWSAPAILEPDAIWGDWRAAPALDKPTRKILDRLDGRLRQDLAAYGMGVDRFGLIHADMRLDNLLMDGEVARLIDFDDCGFCWFGYDFAAAISFFEDDARVPELKAAWLQGYRAHRAFSPEDERRLDTLIMLRRMALLAWIGSHAEVDLAKALAPAFAPTTAALAERYLSGRLYP